MAGINGAERAELHRTIWRIANDLRGSVDGWDFKSYVLGTLFYRFVSENLTAYLDESEHKAGNPDFDYAALSDEAAEFGRRETVIEKGFYILPSQLFANVRRGARHDENLNETLARVFAAIEGSAIGGDSEDDLKGLFDDLDVNSNKLGPTVAKRNEKLVKLLDGLTSCVCSRAFERPGRRLAGWRTFTTTFRSAQRRHVIVRLYGSHAARKPLGRSVPHSQQTSARFRAIA